MRCGDSPLSPEACCPTPLQDEGEEADDEAQDEIASDVPMSPEIPHSADNTPQFVKVEALEPSVKNGCSLNSSVQEVVVIESDERGEGELIEISDDDEPRSLHEESEIELRSLHEESENESRSLHEESENSLIEDDGRSETLCHSGERCGFYFCVLLKTKFLLKQHIFKR